MNCLLVFVLLGQTILASGPTDDFQKAKDNLKATLLILDKLEGGDQKEGNVCLLVKPANCAEIMLQGHTTSGIYTIYPRIWYKKAPFKVYCDMDTDGGGWTVFQKRGDYEVHENFYRSWDDYRKGFGSLNEEFWLGNDNLHLLTQQDRVTMRIDLEDFEDEKRYAHYQKFEIGNEANNFRLSIGEYTGDVGDDLGHFDKVIFVTFDKSDVNNCSKNYKGGWWYTKCHKANLNGLYLRGNHTSYADGIEWGAWRGHHYSLKRSEMKIRPVQFLSCDEK